MCIQYLLEESRPRARKPDDEDRAVLHGRTVASPSRDIVRVATIRRQRPHLRLLFRRFPRDGLDERQLRTVGLVGRAVGLIVAPQRVTSLRKRVEEVVPMHEFLLML